jgi:hypothetical protein
MLIDYQSIKVRWDPRRSRRCHHISQAVKTHALAAARETSTDVAVENFWQLAQPFGGRTHTSSRR